MASKGFSLIEVSIALVIIGVFIVPVVSLYETHMKQRQISDTEGALWEIQFAVNDFVNRQGRYPIPASLNLVETDKDYGKEGTATPPLCTSPTWFATDGLCITPGSKPAYIGAVPVNTLGINPDVAHDYWSNKILYAVSATQTDAASYAVDAGEIQVKVLDSNRNVIDIPDPSSPPDKDDSLRDMVLISSGPNGAGGYTRAGVEISPCIQGGAQLEDENCDMDNVFILRQDFITGIGSVSNVPGPHYYDDFTLDQKQVPSDYWAQNVVTTNYAVSKANRIGIGTTDPKQKIHVAGDIQANSNIMADDICSYDSSGNSPINCFHPSYIAGIEDSMNCSTNGAAVRAVVGIGELRVSCASPAYSNGDLIDPSGSSYEFPTGAGYFVTKNCVDNYELMIGIDSNGEPICAVP